jgi:hypothetical protein
MSTSVADEEKAVGQPYGYSIRTFASGKHTFRMLLCGAKHVLSASVEAGRFSGSTVSKGKGGGRPPFALTSLRL